MYYLIGFQKLRKNAADSLIDRDGAETSADDQDYRAIGRKMGVLESRQTIPVQKLFTDRGTGNLLGGSGAFVLKDFSRNTFPCIFAKCDFLYGAGRSQRR